MTSQEIVEAVLETGTRTALIRGLKAAQLSGTNRTTCAAMRKTLEYWVRAQDRTVKGPPPPHVPWLEALPPYDWRPKKPADELAIQIREALASWSYGQIGAAANAAGYATTTLKQLVPLLRLWLHHYSGR